MLAFLGIRECYDPKGELMGGAKEDRAWRWVTLGEQWPGAPRRKTVITTQDTFLSELVGLRFCFRFIRIDLW